MSSSVRPSRALIAFMWLCLISACGGGSGGGTTPTPTAGPPLTVTPSSATLTASSGEALQFLGQQGMPPYTYSLVSGPGSLTPQGVYTVGSISGTAAVQVTDSQGATAVAHVRVLRIRVNGPVTATATDGTSIYLGGGFYATNPYSAPHLLVADLTNGNPALGCDLGTGFLDGAVTAVVTSGNSIYVAGTFNHYNGAVVGQLAKIDATTCALDTKFSQAGSFGMGGFGSNQGTIYALALSGNSLFVAGTFQTYRGAPATSPLKIDATSGNPDPTFSVSSGPDNSVNTIAVSSNSVYVGGAFTHFNGVAVPSLAKLDANTGALDLSFANAAPVEDMPGVSSLAVSGSALYVAGSFAHYGGIATNLAKLDATTGALDVSFTQNVAQYTSIGTILPTGNSVYIGRYNNPYPTGLPLLVKVDSTTGVADPVFTNAVAFNGAVNTLAPVGPSLYVGGAFTADGGQPAHGLAKIDATTGALDTTFTHVTGVNTSSGESSIVQAIAAAGSVLVAGGDLTTYGGQPVPIQGLAKFSIATGLLDPSFAGNGGVMTGISALALNGSSLYVGGTSLGCIVEVDAGSGLIDTTFTPPPVANCVMTFTTGTTPPTSTTVNTLLVYGGSLYAGGGKTGLSVPGFVCKVDLVTGTIDPAFTATVEGVVLTLAAQGSAVYIGGTFDKYSGSAASNLVKADAATGAMDPTFTQGLGVASAGPYSQGVVNRLLANGTALYAGGYFTSYGGIATPNLIKIDGNSGVLDTAFAGQITSTGPEFANALATDGVSLYVAGLLAGGPNGTPNVLKINLTTGTTDGAFSNPNSVSGASSLAPASFTSLTLAGGQLYVGVDTAISYRGTIADYLFAIDPGTGALQEP